jgi:hypothetical protein
MTLAYIDTPETAKLSARAGTKPGPQLLQDMQSMT